MSWKFWKKDNNNSSSDSVEGAKKLPRPKDLPQEIGRHLVVDENYDPDWVWSLRYVTQSQGGSNAIFDFRIFSESAAADQNVRIRDYHSLDAHADLILFDGWFDRKTRKFEFVKKLDRAV